MEKLYGPEEERLSRPGKEESGDDEEEWMTFDEGLFLAAARRLYEGERVDADFLRGDEARALTAETARVLRGAVRGSVRQETPAGLTAALESDAFEFSGLKTYHSLKEAGLSLTDERGDVRPFEDFMEDVLAVSGRYNRNWLRSEYNHAVGASQMAVRWNDFDKDSGRYDLQYRTAKDSLVRPDHAALDGITLPASDPFWNLYLPPNGWNCRCTAAEVRRGKYDRSDPDRSMRLGDEATDAPGMRMFRFNPGKSLRLFPPKHPYHKAPEEIKEAVRGMAEEEAKKRRPPQEARLNPVQLKFRNPDRITKAEVTDAIKSFAGKNPGLFLGGLRDVMIINDKRASWFMANSRYVNPATGEPLGNVIKIVNKHFLRRDFNPYEELKGALRAIAKGEGLTFKQEYALEGVWHEIRHASAVGFENRNSIREEKLTNSMETVNQFCARHSYGGFVEALGGKAAHTEEVISGGYGYSKHVSNFQSLLGQMGVTQEEAHAHFKDMITKTRYEDIHGEIVRFVQEKGGYDMKTADDIVEQMAKEDAQEFAVRLENSERDHG